MRNTLDPLRVIYRRALKAGAIAINPMDLLDLPAKDAEVRDAVDHITAQSMIDAVPEKDRALWALAFWAGLRRGELAALRWSDIDLEAGVITIARSYDYDEGAYVEPKTKAGIRRVPMIGPVRQLLARHGTLVPRTGDELIFGRTASEPFTPGTIARRATKAWDKAKLPRVTLHGARHSNYNVLRESDLDRYQLKHVFGHTSATDSDALYGHLTDGELARIAAQVDGFIGEPETA